MSDLTVTDLEVHRAGSPIVQDVSLSVPAGKVTVFLGANGAGKTTLLESISGLIPVQSGSIMLGATDITRMARSGRARVGLAHVEQGRSIFSDLTVEENFLVCAPRSRIGAGFEMFPALEARRHGRAGLLSGGEQQMLVIARALLTNPTVLLLDEMSLGLAPTIIKRLTPVVRRLADEGVGVLLVEQFAALALPIADHAYVMVHGRIAYDGAPQVLIDEPDRLREMYLGGTA